MDAKAAIINICNGLIYFSESDFPVKVKENKPTETENIIDFIQDNYHCSLNEIIKIPPEIFFERFHRNIDLHDKPLQENAAKFRTLQKLLTENFEEILIFRVEKNALIPILIFAENQHLKVEIFIEILSEET